MTVFRALHRASFRGVDFLVRSSETEQGRKTVTFEYPNSSTRFVEDLGALKRTCNITGIITEPFYTSKRNALIKALNTPGIGKLVHPFYGTISVVPKPYTITEEMTVVGEATFQMVFEESGEGIYPIDSDDNLGIIAENVEDLYLLLRSIIGSVFSIIRGHKFNFISAVNKLGVIGSLVNDATQPFSDSSESSIAFSNTLIDFQKNIVPSVSDPLLLADSMDDLFSSMSTMKPSASDRFKMGSALYGFGLDDAEIPPTTVKRIEKKKNNDLLNSAVNMYALINSYQDASLIDYGDETELNAVEKDLENQYRFVIDTSTLTFDSLKLLKDLRVNFIEFANEQRKNIFKIEEITVKNKSIAVLVYEYYGNLDNLDRILELNDVKAPSRYSGTLKILTR